MFQFRLRTLLLVLAIGPPVLAGAWLLRTRIVERNQQRQFDALIDEIANSIVPVSTTLTGQ